MRITTAAAVVTGLLAFVPASSFAQSTTSSKPAAAAKAVSTPKAHEATGVVKSVNATSLVIARGGSNGKPMAFDISPSATREGVPEIGSSVSIRYHEDGKKNVATDIAVKPVKTSSANGKSK